MYTKQIKKLQNSNSGENNNYYGCTIDQNTKTQRFQ